METYVGHVRTPADAIILFEACRLGLLPRVQRRLSEKERQSIKSGSVFVWDEREAGMRRWTDGKSWSASRVSGSFLTYREMEGKRGGPGFTPSQLASFARIGRTPESMRGSDSDIDNAGDDGPDGYRYKPDGLMKQSFSITTSTGNHLHLISYYSRSHPNAAGLNSPTNDPTLRHIRPQKGMYPESTVHEQQNIPPVTRSPMAPTPYSTTPQMAGYARPNQHPPPPVGYPQAAYGYPQPPPQVSHPGYAYHYATNGAPPPPSNGHSPLSYSQTIQPPPIPQAPTSSGYERHLGPPTTNSLPPLNNHPTSSADNAGAQHIYQQPSPYAHPPPPYMATPPLMATTPHQARPGSHSSTPVDPRIDPQLYGSSSTGQPPSQAPKPSGSSPLPAKQGNGNTPPKEPNGLAQPTTMPSINSMMNGNESAKLEMTSSSNGRSPSRSPGGSEKKDGPKDIPNEKMSFNEDNRALKALNRQFIQ